MGKGILSERIQCARVENEFSSWKPVKSGIPQGSVLGSVLFVIFINDMPDYVESMCQLFADDAKIFRSVKSNEDNIILQRDINKLSTWADEGTTTRTGRRRKIFGCVNRQ